MSNATNIGEYVAGAYYTICLKATSVLYNEPICFDETNPSTVWINDIKHSISITRDDIEELVAEDFDIDKMEIDVAAIANITETSDGSTQTYIAECSESYKLKRGYPAIRKKLLADIIYAATHGADLNIQLEIWAPNIPQSIIDKLPELEKELILRYREMAGTNQETVTIKAVCGEEYTNRIKKLFLIAKKDTSNKLKNPFYRALQIIARTGIDMPPQ